MDLLGIKPPPRYWTVHSCIKIKSILYLHKLLKTPFPPSCCCFWTRSTAGCQLTRLDRGVCLHRNGLPAHMKTEQVCVWSSVGTEHIRQVSAWYSVDQKTFERRFSPETVSDLHMVVPAQMASKDIHGCKIQNNLREGRHVLLRENNSIIMCHSYRSRLRFPARPYKTIRIIFAMRKTEKLPEMFHNFKLLLFCLKLILLWAKS